MNGIDFLKSDKTDLRANAAIFIGLSFFLFFLSLPAIGFLLGNLTAESRKLITKEHVCGGL
jgi:hypothetical protein